MLFASCDRGLDNLGSNSNLTAFGGAGAALLLPDGAAAGGSGGEGGAGVILPQLPPGFTATEIGGYKLGPPLELSPSAGGAPAENPRASDCGNVLLGVVRDFKSATEPGGDPDFESFLGTEPTLHLVSDTLGSDKKPVYTSQCELGSSLDMSKCPFGAETTTRQNFDQWYRDTLGVNLPFALYFYFHPDGDGLFTFSSTEFFPLDDAGYGNTLGKDHNYSFTTELHTRFRYEGGETFEFTGDDDVWVFMNGKLTVDLGGLHSKQDRRVSLDQVASADGLALGGVYDLDLFHAERHSAFSDFAISTDLAFVNCGIVEPEVVK